MLQNAGVSKRIKSAYEHFLERHVVQEVSSWADLKEFNEPVHRSWKDALIILFMIVSLAAFWTVIFFFLFL